VLDGDLEQSEPAEEPRLLTRNFVAVVIAQMTFGYAVSTFLLLPKFLATELHGTAAQIGHVGAIPGCTAALLVPFVGSAVDHFGRRPLMRAGSALGAVCAVLWLWVDAIGPEVYGLQILSGTAFILAASGASTLVADAAPPAKLSQALGIFGAGNITMSALSPAIAEPLAARFGWHSAFVVAAMMFAGAFGLTLRVREPARASLTAADGPVPHAFAHTVQVARKLLPYMIATLACGAAYGAVFTFYQPFVLAQGAEHVSTFFVGFTSAAVTTRLGLGGLADRLGRRRIALWALSAYTLMVLAMTQLTPERLFPLGFGFGLAHGFFFPALNAYALEFTALPERGRAMTLVNGGFHLGITSSVFCCGWIAEAYGYPYIFVFAAAVTSIGVCALYWDQPLAARRTLRTAAP
jgi:MFS family permease